MTTRQAQTGLVLTATRKTYIVELGERRLTCTIRGKLVAEDSDAPAVRVGDRVKVVQVSDHEGVIEELLPRKSQLSRTIASRAYQEHIIAVNIDQILIILSTKKPLFKSGLLDRYLIIAEKNRLRALICINKIDLDDPGRYQVYRDYYPRWGYPLFFSSVVSGEGLAELKEVLKNNLTALVGQSGVGKSSLIKAIAPEVDIKIGEVSERTHKGQHTTTAAQIFKLAPETYVVDTPGIRELGFWGVYRKDLPAFYPEIRAFAPDCKFADCLHIQEPGCAVKAAVERGEMLPERYRNYVNICSSLKSAHYE